MNKLLDYLVENGLAKGIISILSLTLLANLIVCVVYFVGDFQDVQNQLTTKDVFDSFLNMLQVASLLVALGYTAIQINQSKIKEKEPRFEQKYTVIEAISQEVRFSENTQMDGKMKPLTYFAYFAQKHINCLQNDNGFMEFVSKSNSSTRLNYRIPFSRPLTEEASMSLFYHLSSGSPLYYLLSTIEEFMKMIVNEGNLEYARRYALKLKLYYFDYIEAGMDNINRTVDSHKFYITSGSYDFDNAVSLNQTAVFKKYLTVKKLLIKYS